MVGHNCDSSTLEHQEHGESEDNHGLKKTLSSFYNYTFLWGGGIQDRFFCVPLLSRTHYLDHTGLKLRNQPACSSQMLGLKVCIATPGLVLLKIGLSRTPHVEQAGPASASQVVG